MMRRRKLMVIQEEDEYFVPDYFQVTSSTSVKRGRRFLVDVYTTPDANKIIITEAKYPVITGFLSQSVGIMQK